MNDENPRRRLGATPPRRVRATLGGRAVRRTDRSSTPPRARHDVGQDRHGR
jgi:hypothetical protein